MDIRDQNECDLSEIKRKREKKKREREREIDSIQSTEKTALSL
jgi:hypothetical protein